MAMNDLLAQTLSAIKNAEARNKDELEYSPTSKVVREVLTILKNNNYIDSFECVENKLGGKVKIMLANKINKIGVIKPRFPVSVEDIEKFEKRYLPARNFGFLIISTPKGMMTHLDARKNNYGGVLIAYVY